MNRLLVFLGCLVVLVLVLGCQSDIMLPKAWSLVGTYTGTYSYITNYAAGQHEERISEYVIFIFDETAYHMNLDTTQELENCFCAVDGQWALTVGVRLQENNSGPEEGCEGACNEEMNPEGVFILQTMYGSPETTEDDSLILKMEEETAQEGTTLYMLRLKKTSD